MTTKEALKLIKSLACLRDYPKGYPDAEAALADRLMLASGADLKLASAIIREFEEKSPTLADISEVARQLRGAMATPGNGFREHEKPAIVCSLCNDTGVITIDLVKRTYGWCNCSQGARLREELPDWLDTMNRITGRRVQ
jgi:hypothetical protein